MTPHHAICGIQVIQRNSRKEVIRGVKQGVKICKGCLRIQKILFMKISVAIFNKGTV